MVATLCERCGRMSADRLVHDDLYHPVPRRRKSELITAVAADGPAHPVPSPEPEAAPSDG